MKQVLRDLIIALLTVLAIPIALYVGLSLMKLQKVARGTFKIGQRLTAPVVGGARALTGRIADKSSQSGNKLFRGLGRVVTGTARPGGARRMAAMGAEYMENRKKIDDAYKTYVLNRKGATAAASGSRRADDIVAGLQGMKLEDVANMRPATIRVLLAHNDQRVVEVTRDLLNRALRNPTVQSKITPDQIAAMTTGSPLAGGGPPVGPPPNFFVPPVVAPPGVRPGVAPIQTGSVSGPQNAGRWVLKQFGRRPGWPKP